MLGARLNQSWVFHGSGDHGEPGGIDCDVPKHGGQNENNRGNQVEHLAWLALGADRCKMILAIAWQAHHLQIEEP